MPKNYNSTVAFYRAALNMEDLITIAEVLGRDVPETLTCPDSTIVPLLRHVRERNRYVVLSEEMEYRIYNADPHRRYILKLATFEQEDTGHMHAALNVVQQGSFMETAPGVILSNYFPVGYSDVMISLSTNVDPLSIGQPYGIDCDRHSPRATYLLADSDTSIRDATRVHMHNTDLWIGTDPDLFSAPDSFFVPDGFSAVPWDPNYWCHPVLLPGEDITFDLAGGDEDRPPYIVSAARQGDGYAPTLELI